MPSIETKTMEGRSCRSRALKGQRELAGIVGARVHSPRVCTNCTLFEYMYVFRARQYRSQLTVSAVAAEIVVLPRVRRAYGGRRRSERDEQSCGGRSDAQHQSSGQHRRDVVLCCVRPANSLVTGHCSNAARWSSNVCPLRESNRVLT